MTERDLPDLSVGRTAHVSLTALPGKVLDARVREVAAAADPQSRTWRVKLTLLSPGPDVRSGMTASISFDGGADTAQGAQQHGARAGGVPGQVRGDLGDGEAHLGGPGRRERDRHHLPLGAPRGRAPGRRPALPLPLHLPVRQRSGGYHPLHL